MKKENIFFENFAECAVLSCEMAEKLGDFLTNYDLTRLEVSKDAIHDLEHKGDSKKHELFSELVRAFVTPIDRNELVNISQSIDDVMDAMDDIMIQLYITQVKHVRENCVDFSKLIIRCCKAMAELMEEFKNFKKSKKLNDLIIELNRLEEDGDRMYIEAMKDLHATSQDALEVIIWREIYATFETVCDKCEDVADIVEGILIENM